MIKLVKEIIAGRSVSFCILMLFALVWVAALAVTSELRFEIN